MKERQQQLIAWTLKVQALVEEMKQADQMGHRSRQQSLATTKLEEASHWLSDELADIEG